MPDFSLIAQNKPGDSVSERSEKIVFAPAVGCCSYFFVRPINHPLCSIRSHPREVENEIDIRLVGLRNFEGQTSRARKGHQSRYFREWRRVNRAKLSIDRQAKLV